MPPGKTRSSRLLLSGSPGTLGFSTTTRPTPLNRPLATTTLLITVRVSDTTEVTMVPLNVSLPLVAAVASLAAFLPPDPQIEDRLAQKLQVVQYRAGPRPRRHRDNGADAASRDQ